MRQLWDRLENIKSREVNIDGIWIPSHCRLPKNDAADELARRGILESGLLVRQDIPFAMEAARSIIKPTMRTNIVRISPLPDELTLSNRRAEAIIHQLMANCSPLVADFHRGRNGDDLVPYKSVCTACQYGVKETVEHLLLPFHRRSSPPARCDSAPAYVTTSAITFLVPQPACCFQAVGS